MRILRESRPRTCKWCNAVLKVVEWADRSCTITRQGISGINCAICAKIMTGQSSEFFEIFEAIIQMEKDLQGIELFDRDIEIRAAMEFFATSDDFIDWTLGCWQ